jgi:hypothetical protein
MFSLSLSHLSYRYLAPAWLEEASSYANIHLTGEVKVLIPLNRMVLHFTPVRDAAETTAIFELYFSKEDARDKGAIDELL